MLRKLQLPSPAMTVALIALFAGFTGSAIAQSVVPLAKRALTADKAKVAANAQKLNGRTAAQIAATPGPATDAATLNGQTAAQIAATPGPASPIPASAITYRTQSYIVDQEGAIARDSALCLSGEKAIGGGFEQESGLADVIGNRPVPDGTGWRFGIFAESGNQLPSVGTIYAVCLKVS